MVLTFRIAFTGLLLLSGASTLILAIFAYRHREVPGALPFAGLVGAMSYWAFVYAIGLQITGDPALRIAVLQAQWLAHPLIPLFLFLFGVTYTGNDEYVTRRTLPIIAAIPVAVVLAAWTNPWHHLLWTDQTVHVVDGMAVLVPTYGPLFWINIVYGYGIEFVAIAALIRLIFTSDYLYRDQSALLLVGVAVPFVANVVEIFVIGSTPAVDPTAVMYAASGLAWGYAVFRKQLLDLIPATRKLGRNEAIGQLDTGIVIVGTDHRVVYANAAAGEVFDRSPSDMLGRPVREFVDDEWIDFEAEDALAEAERGERVFEIRQSAITGRSDRNIGHTLVFHDVTARKRRERELSTVNDLNAVIRGVNQALVSATSREEIERAVCERLAGSSLYETVCIGDVQTWTGEADRWHVDGGGTASDAMPPEVGADRIHAAVDGASDRLPAPTTADGDGDAWLVAPVVYGHTVYGAIGLSTRRSSVSDRELSVLGELGELVGNAIHAVESRSLLGAEEAIELTVSVDGRDDPIAAAAGEDAELEVLGVVPRSDEGHLAFLEVASGSVDRVHERLASADVDARVVSEDGDGGVVELVVDETVSLAPIVASDAHLREGHVTDDRVTYEVLVPSTESGRTLLDRLSAAFPSTDLRSKREREHPFAADDGLSRDRLAELTDRQREALEAAVRAGYFEWPRDADAEAVADSMDITSPTLHRHLRTAERTLLEDLFDLDDDA